jgi:hypothetical protein
MVLFRLQYHAHKRNSFTMYKAAIPPHLLLWCETEEVVNLPSAAVVVVAQCRGGRQATAEVKEYTCQWIVFRASKGVRVPFSMQSRVLHPPDTF